MPAATPLSAAAVLHGAGDLRIEHRAPTLPQPGYATVQVMATTLCGSDRTSIDRPLSSLA